MTTSQPGLKAKRMPRPRGFNVVSMTPQPPPVPPPKHLPKQEAALWRSLTGAYQLDDDGALEILTTALEARARMRRCRERIDKDGEAVTDRWDQLRAHPLLAGERAARLAYLAALRLLNLDLSSAAK